ncbi:hypothetical protein J6590_044728 [Homalodisca vitripennis]|nr:hypothetical protein J6590_044728 [Homalodisca vitripennis]
MENVNRNDVKVWVDFMTEQELKTEDGLVVAVGSEQCYHVPGQRPVKQYRNVGRGRAAASRRPHRASHHLRARVSVGATQKRKHRNTRPPRAKPQGHSENETGYFIPREFPCAVTALTLLPSDNTATLNNRINRQGDPTGRGGTQHIIGRGNT